MITHSAEEFVGSRFASAEEKRQTAAEMSLYKLEQAVEKWMPVLVAALSVAMLITFPLCISNFHKIHTKGENDFIRCRP